MADQVVDPDTYVKAQQFTPKTYRDVYPAINPTNPSLSQAGKVVLITGASQGIGATGFARSFAATGPKAIVLVARNAQKLDAVVADIKEKYPKVETLAVPTDVADPASVAALFEKVKSTYGHADVLVNNAAVFNTTGAIKDTINVRGTFLMTQAFLRLLPDSASARIITLSTGAPHAVFPGLSHYMLAKLVVTQLQAYITAENPNVVAVAVHPGMVPTEMMKDFFRPFAKDTPELVGGLATWVAAWEDGDRSFLGGRYLSANWDVENLVQRKKDIVEKELLKIHMEGDFGSTVRSPL